MSPAAWKEDLILVRGVSVRRANDTERKKLHHFADDPLVACLTPAKGEALMVAARSESRPCLMGPFSTAAHARTSGSGPRIGRADGLTALDSVLLV